MDHTDHYRIDRSTEAWRNEKLQRGFTEAHGCAPSKVYSQLAMECECCDDAHPQPQSLAERCQVTEFDFGPRWTFVIYDHKRADGMAHMSVLDVYHQDQAMTSFTFDKAVKAPRGWLGSVVQAETKMLQMMNAPVDKSLLPENPKEALTAAFRCKLDEVMA